MDYLKVENIEKRYGKRKVVNNVSLDVKSGEVVGLLGPNGAGKTTTFYSIIGLIKPDKGKIFINDKDITRLPMYMRARLGIGFLPQESSVFRKLTVEENLLCVLEFIEKDKKKRKEIAEKLLLRFGIAHLRNNLAYTLSGGERRRVEIARALCTNPRFLLMDEPFTGIDPITQKEIQKIILELKADGIGILITDHNVRETLEITDRAYLMYDGRILLSGDRDTVIKDLTAKKVYFGEDFSM